MVRVALSGAHPGSPQRTPRRSGYQTRPQGIAPRRRTHWAGAHPAPWCRGPPARGLLGEGGPRQSTDTGSLRPAHPASKDVSLLPEVNSSVCWGRSVFPAMPVKPPFFKETIVAVASVALSSPPIASPLQLGSASVRFSLLSGANVALDRHASTAVQLAPKGLMRSLVQESCIRVLGGLGVGNKFDAGPLHVGQAPAIQRPSQQERLRSSAACHSRHMVK